MRGSRALRLTALALAAGLLAACSGGSGGNTPGAGDGGSSSAAPLHVVSVLPATLTGTTPIVVTFRDALSNDSALPTIKPAVPGSWVRNGTTATFTPSQAYPPSTKFKVQLVRRSGRPAATIATAISETGSLRFADQILARLQYLPLTTTAPTPTDAVDEAAAVYDPPPGGLTWRFSDTPATIKKDWQAGKDNTVLRGAVIAFQHQSHLTQDGAIGPATWAKLEAADLADTFDPDHYSYVSANLYEPQTLSVWVDGKTVLTTPVNGGVAGAPTPLGTYPIYLRYTATTMQGTNPDGSKYKDPGVPWVNYFSGGSAVHGFPRASYGFPQSVGCLELPIDTAKTVYGLIDYGTLVTVAGPYVAKSVATPSPPQTASPKPSTKPSGKPSAKPKPSTSPGATVTPTPTASASDLPLPTRTPRH
ncbi:MAG TPA: L,D-transpeptidase family protein [Mycobacteriales bacterium]|jgi:peptidoglycan hydrolase-like protein with peptidoglycan-binding domain|nr:L,D-transpeptidase family protein [Mycobacteriales bacterium]